MKLCTDCKHYELIDGVSRCHGWEGRPSPVHGKPVTEPEHCVPMRWNSAACDISANLWEAKEMPPILTVPDIEIGNLVDISQRASAMGEVGTVIEKRTHRGREKNWTEYTVRVTQ